MNHSEIATTLRDAKEKIVLLYAFNATGKTRLSVSYKDATKNKKGAHTGVYYNAYSEDLFVWQNDPENDGTPIQLDIRKCSLNKFHSALTEDNVRDKLNRFKPGYRFEFIYYDDPQDGIQAVSFFQEVPDPNDANNVAKVTYKISRGEERIFIWCFFLALFEVDGWADQQAAHFFIDDPVSSLDDHNIFITASTLFDLIEDHFEKRKIIITTHHLGFFAILADWLKKGEKADKFKKHSKVGILSAKNGELALESPNNDVLLYHLRLLQLLEQAWAANEVRAFHFALLRQVLENVASFLGVGQFGYVLMQIGIDDPDDTARVINTLSHKKVYYFESEILEKDSRDLFDKIFLGLKSKYNFVLHASEPAPAPAPAP
ncbi:AAA family ATPase [Pelagibacterium flavum]|uniref:AAA family ATPase n=1 Tax=Pelagibacterium flavum TaxID=2984530 RepID=A0ABY6IJT8_9HYPH|nr:AAA family ATPase [Pelagibacterium sp. YIM 151497]UYQ70879.1 AAA family ATPase [Pelagibacterium sp. YIM 151497]